MAEQFLRSEDYVPPSVSSSRGRGMMTEQKMTVSSTTQTAPAPAPSLSPLRRPASPQRGPSARERELDSLLRGAEKAFRSQFEAQQEKMQRSYEKELRERDIAIETFKKVLVQRDELVLVQNEKIQTNNAVLEEKSREGRREIMAAESSLRADVTRLRLEKEKERYVRELIEKRREESANEVLQLQDALNKFTEEGARDRLLAQEEAESPARAAIRQQEGLEWFHIQQSLEMVASQSKQHHSLLARQHAFLSLAMDRLLVLPDDPSQDTFADLRFDGLEEPLMTMRTKISALHEYYEAKLLSSWNQREEQVEEIRRYVEDAEALRSTIKQWEGDVEQKMAELQDRLRQQQHFVMQLQEKDKGRSRAHRAADVTLDSLIEEHEHQTSEMKGRISELEDELRYHKHINRAAEAEEWQRKAETIAKDVIELRDERSMLHAQCTALQAEVKDHDSSTKLLLDDLKVQRSLREQMEADLTRVQAELSSASKESGSLQSEMDHVNFELEKEKTLRTESTRNLQTRVDSLEKSNQFLRQKWIDLGMDAPREDDGKDKEQASASDGPQFARLRFDLQSGPSQPISTESEKVAELEHRVLLLKKERDSLKRQLDSAAAETASSEERRVATMKKYLDLLSATDSAPRREQGIQAQLFQLQQKENEIIAKQKVYEQRVVELEKREAQITRTIAAYQARGTNLLSASTEGGPMYSHARKSLTTPSEADSSSVLSAGATPTSLSAPQGRRQLAPIAARPLPQQAQSSSPSHPQRAPRYQKYL